MQGIEARPNHQIQVLSEQEKAQQVFPDAKFFVAAVDCPEFTHRWPETKDLNGNSLGYTLPPDYRIRVLLTMTEATHPEIDLKTGPGLKLAADALGVPIEQARGIWRFNRRTWEDDLPVALGIAKKLKEEDEERVAKEAREGIISPMEQRKEVLEEREREISRQRFFSALSYTLRAEESTTEDTAAKKEDFDTKLEQLSRKSKIRAQLQSVGFSPKTNLMLMLYTDFFHDTTYDRLQLMADIIVKRAHGVSRKDIIESYGKSAANVRTCITLLLKHGLLERQYAPNQDPQAVAEFDRLYREVREQYPDANYEEQARIMTSLVKHNSLIKAQEVSTTWIRHSLTRQVNSGTIQSKKRISEQTRKKLSQKAREHYNAQPGQTTKDHVKEAIIKYREQNPANPKGYLYSEIAKQTGISDRHARDICLEIEGETTRLS